MVRWTIYRQFLYPVLAIVGLVVVATAAVTTLWNIRLAERRERQHLAQIVDTLTSPEFPLSLPVLEKMSGLSGAQFALFDPELGIQDTTLALSDVDRAALVAWIQAATASQSGHSLLTLGQRSYLADLVPLRSSRYRTRPRFLVALSPQQPWSHAAIDAMRAPIITGAIGGLVLMATLAWLVRRIVRPVCQVQRQAEHIAEGDFHLMELPQRRDEIYELVTAINSMVERLRHYEQQVRRQERLDTLGQLAGGLAHHLRNAATGSRLAVELHQRQCPLGGDHEDLQVARRQLKSMENYLQRLLVVGRGAELSPQSTRAPVRLSELVEQVQAFVEPVCRHMQIQFSSQVMAEANDAMVWADAAALEQVLTSLAMNAVDAVKSMPPANRRVELLLDGGDEHWDVSLRDWGPGPAPDVAERLFEPFATNKPDGIGLGLALARAVAAAYGGGIDWRRDRDTTTFSLRLPRGVCEEEHGALAHSGR